MTGNAIQARPPAVMSIDIEDWFHTENMTGVVARESWETRELRVERNVDRMLELMSENGVKSTCFVLGWVAEKRPGLVARIAAEGHEIATHGYGHELIYRLSESRFRDDVERSIKLLEDAGGQSVRGYRAPCFSITDWAVPILQELGLTYDSSAFPTVAHDRYGRLSGIVAGEPICELRPGFLEVCVSCLQIGRHGLPWAGGGYFRLIPYSLFRRGVRRILASAKPYVFYIHPWEIDPGQPRLRELGASNRFRQYLNLERIEKRFARLLAEFEWTTMADLLAGWRPATG